MTAQMVCAKNFGAEVTFLQEIQSKLDKKVHMLPLNKEG